MIKLGVTGGIGSGKSYVCNILSSVFQIPIYNCDIRARIITLCESDVIKALSALVPGLYNDDGELDKSLLSQYLFASEEHAREVNAIVHPAVRRDLHEWYSRCSAPIVAVESAILYESHFDTEVDKVLFVDAPLDLRVQRVLSRDGLSEQEVLSRIAMQRADEALSRADFVVSNDEVSPLIPQLQDIFSQITINES